jgi:two-component system cell cycle sensor histidine kinase/response regulator CckA
LMVVPLQVGGRVSGAMTVALTEKGRFYDPDDLATVEDLARRTALAMDHVRLLREAREIFDGDLTGNFVASADGALLDCNGVFARMLGFASVDDALASSATAILGGDVNWRGFVGGVSREGRLRQHEIALQTPDGVQVHVLVSATGLFNEAGTITTIRGQFYDLTAHKQLEEQLSQSQKMEAVGRLAGGIAHDFNNLMTVIGGQAGGLLERLERSDPLARKVEAIVAAADRATGLTQQLLAFSRRQVLSPQVVSPNTIVSNVHGMLERLIGEDITCVLSLASEVDNVRADPMRIEQALLNLAVNARDAMPDGGALTISTSVVELDDVYSRQHAAVRPGRYVMLAVSDTGSGMAPETRIRVFEPFFTTKEIGKGTGLGLPMVYGIVKQSGGYIWVYSELGIGTTFKIYLPSVDAPVEEPHPRPAPELPTGTETVLLVEDEDGVRELLQEILTEQGYRVLAASRGSEALGISDSTHEEIPLLVTDVVMPKMSGRELAHRLRLSRPALRVLYLSGYTEEAIAQHGIIEPDAAFLQKPFTRADLARKIREVLAPRVEQ